jgi:hypothetical protein
VPESEAATGAPRLWKRLLELSAMQETAIGPDEVINALRQYLENTGESRRAAAVKMGVSYHSIGRWLTDTQSPQKANLIQVAGFLRREGFL